MCRCVLNWLFLDGMLVCVVLGVVASYGTVTIIT